MVLKVDIRADFGARMLENACLTLLWPVLGPWMTGLEIGFDFGGVIRN